MSNTINVNYMTRAYNQYQQKNAAKDQKKEDTRFADSVREKSEASGSIVGNSKIGSVSAKDMTMVEYKQYIYNKISQIPMHPTRAGESISVTISEAGFEAMKNDPEYEAWVLNDLQVGWSQPDKWSGICGGAFSTIYYGASKEECHAEMWSAGYNNGNGGKIFNDKSKNSFWERRIENKKRIENQVKKQQEKKRIQKKQAERTAYEEYAQNMPFSASYLTTKIWNIIKQRKRIQALYYSQLIKNEEEGNSHPEEKEELELLPQTDKELLDKIVNFINNHLDNPDLTVDSLVEEAGISRSALFKKIKTLIGISPMELIKNIRLKKAAELVKEGSCNFTQIAYKTGFNDSQYFSKCFKQIYGVTPTEYKRKNLS